MKSYLCTVLLACWLQGSQASDMQGPFNAVVRSIEKCTPSIAQDPNNLKVDIDLQAVKVSDTEQDIRGNITYYNTVVLDKIVVTAKTEDANDPEPVDIKKVIKKPCDNLLFGVLLKKSFKADDNCAIKKGTFKVDGMGPNKVLHLLFKGFHYGVFDSVVEWSSKDGAIGCIKTVVEVTKP